MDLNGFLLRHDALFSAKKVTYDRYFREPFVLSKINNQKKVRYDQIRSSNPQSVEVCFLNFKMSLDMHETHDVKFFELSKQGELYEPDVTHLISNTLKKGMTFVDIGANNGYYSLLASKLIGSGKVYAFEPSTNGFTRLEQNIKLNKAKNIKAHKCALGATNGSGVLGLSNVEDGLNSMVTSASAPEKYEQVEIQRLDNAVTGKVDLIKIDTEGYEKEVLIGAMGVLDRNKDVKIVMEYNHDEIYAKDKDYDGAINILLGKGFTIREILGVDRIGTKPIRSHKDLSRMLINLYCYRA